MYSRLLDTIRADTPVVAFAEPGSVGERLLLDAFTKTSFQHRPLQPCRGMGYIPRPQGHGVDGLVVTAVTENYDESSPSESHSR